MALRLSIHGERRAFDLVMMDCDGVIFDTNRAKTEAFRHALASYPAPAVDELVLHHMAHGGVSRYEKISRFFAEIHPVDDVATAMDEALRRYRRFAQNAYRSTAPLQDALAFARHAAGLAAVHVVSGSDEQGLKEIFAYHAIRSVFDGIHGSPTDKPTHIGRLLEESGVEASRCLFIGDGRSDFEASRTHDVQFIFLAARSEWADAHAFIEQWETAFVVRDWPDLLGQIGK